MGARLGTAGAGGGGVVGGRTAATEVDGLLERLDGEARAWERVYNTVHRHEALGYLTPLEFMSNARRAGPSGAA